MTEEVKIMVRSEFEDAVAEYDFGMEAVTDVLQRWNRKTDVTDEELGQITRYLLELEMETVE